MIQERGWRTFVRISADRASMFVVSFVCAGCQNRGRFEGVFCRWDIFAFVRVAAVAHINNVTFQRASWWNGVGFVRMGKCGNEVGYVTVIAIFANVRGITLLCASGKNRAVRDILVRTGLSMRSFVK